jgi:uncharacterized membrane protein YhiD involved in acid resistance
MQDLWAALDSGGGPFAASTFDVLISLLLAFVLGQALAWVYYATHTGLSYSRNFVQSLVLITVVIAMAMAVIANSIVTAVGLMGAMAIIRFRNMLKDTRDIAFVFCALAIGMACGSMRFSVAIVGTAVLTAISFYLHRFGFGAHEPHNAFLRLRTAGPLGDARAVTGVLDRYTRRWVMAAAAEPGTGPSEYTFHLQLSDTERNAELLDELQQLATITDLDLTLQEQLLEI